MDEIILYTTGCGKCNMLKGDLNAKGIAYTECTDRQVMMDLGMVTAPNLHVGDKLLDFPAAMAWVAAKGGN